MAGMRYQPQGVARLDRGNPLLRGAQAILVGGMSVNLVTGQPLAVVGPGVASRFVPGGRADLFRKNFYKSTESLDAIGTRDFREFWIGVPSADLGARGSASTSGFLLGSGNNQTGIAGNIGSNNSQGGEGSHWGIVTDPAAWSRLSTANENLVPGALTVLISQRRSDRMEAWRDGFLRRTVMQAPASITASELIVGSFIKNTDYWPASSDMVMAGRLIGAWTPEQIRAFSANPWQIFDAAEYDDLEVVQALGYTLGVERAELALSGGQVGMRVSRRLRAEPAALTVAPGAVALRASRRLVVAPAALEISAGNVALLASRRLGVAPAAMEITAGDAALRVSRRLSVVPAALAIAGGEVAMQYAQKPEPGSYVLDVSATAMTLAGGNVGMRVSRRLRVEPADLALSAGAARLLVGRRLLASPAALSMDAGVVGMRVARRLQVDAAAFVITPGTVTLRYSSQIEYARAPAGAGYSPQRVAVQSRPVQANGTRPPATQEITR